MIAGHDDEHGAAEGGLHDGDALDARRRRPWKRGFHGSLTGVRSKRSRGVVDADRGDAVLAELRFEEGPEVRVGAVLARRGDVAGDGSAQGARARFTHGAHGGAGEAGDGEVEGTKARTRREPRERRSWRRIPRRIGEARVQHGGRGGRDFRRRGVMVLERARGLGRGQRRSSRSGQRVAEVHGSDPDALHTASWSAWMPYEVP